MRQLYFGPFLIEVIYHLLHFKRSRSISINVLTRQILFTGLQALGLVSLIALLLGAIIIVEGHTLLVAVGQTEWIYKVLISALVTDLGPVIVGFIIIGFIIVALTPMTAAATSTNTTTAAAIIISIITLCRLLALPSRCAHCSCFCSFR